jgi:hypothetical protein
MKKFGFVLQVFTLLAALPVLTVLEVNHVSAKPSTNKEVEITLAPEKDKSTCVTVSALPLI